MVPLLIADGDIATTHIIARVIREAYGDVQIAYPATLQRTRLEDRIVIISRLCLPELGWLPGYLNRKNIGYSYFLDDNFFELTVTYDKHNGAFFSHPATQDALTRFIDAADRVIVMSPVLALDLQRRFPRQQIRFISAPIDLALIDRLRPISRAVANEKFRIGYPSTRRPNVGQLLTDVVKQSLLEHGDLIEFEFMGWMPESLRNVPGIAFLPTVDGYENYVASALSRGWNAALAPIMDSAFENCKTNLKYREYAAFGIPGIYSDMPLYASSVKPDQTGLLVPNRIEDWVAALNRLRTDLALRQAITTEARADMERHYAQPLVAAQLKQIVDDAVGQR